MIRSYVDGGNSGHKAKSLSRFNYEKFMQLAENSFNVKKFDRSIDNCRLAVEFALKQGNPEAAATAYQIWIRALFELNRLKEVKKICCEARSKFGNRLDLMYYEFRAAIVSGDPVKAVRLGNEYIGLCGSVDINENPLLTETADKLDEVERALRDIRAEASGETKAEGMEQSNGRE